MKQKTSWWLALALVTSLVLSGTPATVTAAPILPAIQQDEAASDVLTPDALANLTYSSQLTPTGEVTLVDGAYEDTENRIFATLVTDSIAYGQLNGQDVAAVLIGESGGGTGDFISLHLVADQDGAPVAIASTLLGDRVNVHSITIENDQIVVDMVRQGPNDAMCCPTELARVTYALEDGALVVVDETVYGSGPQVYIDAEVESGYQMTTMPPTPYDDSMPPGPVGAPIHTLITFGADDPTTAMASGLPYIAVYPAQEYAQLWEDAGNPTITNLLADLESLLSGQPAAPAPPMPIIPPAGAINDLAAQVAYLSGDGYSGVRFVGREVQDGVPVVNSQLSYYFNGLTDDGQYVISAKWPVSTTVLPATFDDVSPEEVAAAQADITTYLADTTATINEAAADTWSPSLESLDTIVSSLMIQAPGPQLSYDVLANMEYDSLLLEKPVLLTNGVYTETVVPDSASGVVSVQLVESPIAFGTVDGFESAAVLIGENGGGTGDFISLHLVQDIGGEAVSTASVLLGDRPRVTNLAINEDGSITVDMIQVGPNDAFCCANMPMTVTYVKAGDQLVYQDQVSATIDASANPEPVSAFVVQPTAYDNTMPPGGQGEPKHFTWMFGDVEGVTQAMLASGGYVSVYPVEAYKAIWTEAGDPYVDNTLAELQTLLTDQPADPATPLPFLPQMPAVNDFAAQVAYLDLADGGTGMRYVGRFSQDASPIENYQLRYYFQGLSGDGQFLISASIPVTTTLLPDEPQSMSGEEYDQFIAGYDAYMAETTAAFNAAAPSDFTLDLTVLDAMLQSVTPQTSVNPLAPVSLENMEVKSELTTDGVALLQNGIYTETIAPDSASFIEVQMLPYPIAYGTLNDQDTAAVLLAENGGGTGTFISLAAILNQDGDAVHVASAPLGDRVQVQTLAIADNQITVEMIAQGPEDPACCPSQFVTQVYELQEETLVLVDETIGETATSDSALAGTSWVWVETLMNDGAIKSPATADAFVLVFGDDGSASTTTDCNTFSGSYTEGPDGQLTIELPAATMMACPDDSQEQEYIADVTSINSYIITDQGNLALLLPFDSGSIVFAPAAVEETAAEVPAETTEETAATAEVTPAPAEEATPAPAEEAAAAETPAAEEPAALAGTTWNWVQTQYGNGAIAAPADPSLYMLAFGTDGTVNLQDDCNVLNGVYTEGDGGQLTIDLQTSTFAACPPGSLHDQFLIDLSGVASYLFQDGNLFLAIKYDTGIMELVPAE